MKILFTLAIALLACAGAGAQHQSPVSYRSSDRNVWFDLQVAQSFGLNKWIDQPAYNDLLPRVSTTDLRAALNFYLARPVGLFVDMGVSILPSARNPYLDEGTFPTPNLGNRYFLRETLTADPCNSASDQFRMTGGLFCTFATGNPRLDIMPYAGFGLLTVPTPSYAAVIKEEGTNMEYRTDIYCFDDQWASTAPLGYFTARLNFAYKYSPRARLLLGIEYTHMLEGYTVNVRHTNSFNRNLVKSYVREGNRVNMLGVSLGVSFR